MATTSNATSPSLEDRLNRMEEHLAQIREAGAGKVEAIERQVADFAKRNLEIRRRIDGASEGVLTQAHQDANDLEDHVDRWVQELDLKFASDLPRIRNVSM